jgi:hypothetical protein
MLFDLRAGVLLELMIVAVLRTVSALAGIGAELGNRSSADEFFL